ncbi:hypothetical protein BJ508DRAFT_327794 [Ascobolus immersus RN42]|uniref:Uncharacterized protein n=1 Tax=Ascobolus immersus RN42 TaxID=1160509 RepID=A0A3N4I1F5_ASCIM|nr:hypothetical protein BJ508DRAFT_327794 [Ascobolus immersus RN42]
MNNVPFNREANRGYFNRFTERLSIGEVVRKARQAGLLQPNEVVAHLERQQLHDLLWTRGYLQNEAHNRKVEGLYRAARRQYKIDKKEVKRLNRVKLLRRKLRKLRRLLAQERGVAVENLDLGADYNVLPPHRRIDRPARPVRAPLLPNPPALDRNV